MRQPTADARPPVTDAPRVVVCGEILIDLVPAGEGLWRALAGGGPANTAVALARLSTPTAMLARISADAFGAQLRARLLDNGVDLRYVVDADEPSTLAIVDLSDASGARYTFHLDGTADWQWTPPQLPAVFVNSVVAIHAGSMALVRPPGGVVLESLLAREKSRRIVSVDPNVRPAMCPDHAEYARIVERWVGLAHVVKASVDDVNWLYPGRARDEVLADWISRGAALVVLTCGGDGAVAATRGGEHVSVGGRSVPVADTIGAGDTFSAGLLHALDAAGLLDVSTIGDIAAPDVEKALHFAVDASALACTREGADPPWLRELTQPR
ncbi:MAG: carbohydrate kinase family protein [Acidothermaceae bacterium]